jgi:glyoxylate reductase
MRGLTTRPRVVVVGALPVVGLKLLRQRFVVEAGGNRPELNWLRKHAAGAAAIVTDPSIPVDVDLLDAAGRSLEVVSNFGVGYDNIDLEAAHAGAVWATNTPDVLTNATAELAVALSELTSAGRGRLARPSSTTHSPSWSAARTVELSFTGDPLPDVNRRSLAVEPMTCPPNAFVKVV